MVSFTLLFGCLFDMELLSGGHVVIDLKPFGLSLSRSRKDASSLNQLH